MKNSDNIEKLFKDTFENFEADVNPQVWNNVQSGIKSVSGSAASAAGKFAAGKIIAGVVGVALISGSIWYFSADKNEQIATPSKNTQHTEIIANPEIDQQPAVQEKQFNENTPVSATDKHSPPPAIRTLNHYSADYIQQSPVVSGQNDNTVVVDVSTLENNSQQPAHKYGNATQGDGGMIRGIQSASSISSDKNSSLSSSGASDENPEPPTVSIFANTFSGDAPLSVDFMNQSAASSLSWDFGDGTTSRESNPTHTFDRPGTYTVKLTAKNSGGIVSDKVTIEVKAISSITNIPNIFTPNSDGENDVFYFDMKNIASIGVAIFSQRTGELIAKWNNLDGNWNGKLKSGSDAPTGVYLYSIQAIGTDGVTHSEKGFVTITR